MKRILFSTLALAAVLVGCSKSDVVDAPNIDTPISFEAYSGRVPVSKATSINDADDLETEGGFVVYAYNTDATTDAEGSTTYTPNYGSLYFNDVLSYVEDTEGKKTWTYDSGKTYYWPADQNALAFVAYSNNGGEYVTYNTGTESVAPTLTLTVPSAVIDQKDIMVADFTQTKATAENNAVDLTFNHMLSRIYFEMSTDERTIIVSKVSVNGAFFSEGKVSLTTEGGNSVTGTEGKEVTSYDLLPDGTEFTLEKAVEPEETNTEFVCPDGANKDQYYMMIIPGNPSDITIEYTFDGDPTNTEYVATATLDDDFKFVKGKSYKFALTFVAQTIKLNAIVNPWSETNTEDDGEGGSEEVGTTEGIEFTITKKGEGE